MDNLSYCILFFAFIVIGVVGIYLLLRSPVLLKMSKEKNSCTKETKFIWQKEYKSKNLCELSEVKKAEKSGGILSPFLVFYLKLRSDKDVAVFFAPPCPRGFNFVYEFLQMEDKINRFLSSNEKECIVEHSLVELGVAWLVSSSLFSLLLIYVRFFSG